MLVKIDNQAVILDPPDDCKHCESDCYCQLFKRSDPLYFQCKQTPFGPNGICNSEFILGPEIVRNGSFDSSLTNWTPNGYSWSAGKACIIGGFTVGPSQTQPSVVAANQYVLTYTISNASGLALTPVLFDTNGVTRSANGTYTETIIAGTGGVSATLHFDTLGTCCLDNISLKQVLCWAMPTVLSTGWVCSEGKVCHTPGSTDPLIDSYFSAVIGGYYKITVNLESCTAGSATISLAGGIGTTIDDNGSYVDYIYAGGGGGFSFQITPTTDFDGCITLIKAEEMSLDFLADLVDCHTGNEVADIGADLNYYRDWITIIYPWGDAIPNGCYRLRITDTKNGKVYNSNCLTLKTDVGCAQLLQGYSDNEAFGFEYNNTGFRLSQRLEFSLTAPVYRQTTDDYIYSDGRRENNFAQTEKFSTLFIEKVPEFVHDCIQVTRLSKHFSIGDGSDVLTEYFPYPQDYQPEWVKNSGIRVAPSRFEVSKKSDVRFMTNCN